MKQCLPREYLRGLQERLDEMMEREMSMLTMTREALERMSAEGTALRLLEEFAAKNADRVTLRKGKGGRIILKVTGKIGKYVIASDEDGGVRVSETGTGWRWPVCIEDRFPDRKKRIPLADRMLTRAMALLNDEATLWKIHTLGQRDGRVVLYEFRYLRKNAQRHLQKLALALGREDSSGQRDASRAVKNAGRSLVAVEHQLEEADRHLLEFVSAPDTPDGEAEQIIDVLWGEREHIIIYLEAMRGVLVERGRR